MVKHNHTNGDRVGWSSRCLRDDTQGVIPLLLPILLGLGAVIGVSVVMVFAAKLFLTTLIVVAAVVFFVVVMRYGKLKTGRAKGFAVFLFLTMIALAFFVYSPLNATWTGSTRQAASVGTLILAGLVLAVFVLVAVKKKLIDIRLVTVGLTLASIMLSIGGAMLTGGLQMGADYDKVPVREPQSWKFQNNRFEGFLELDSSAYINSWLEGGLGETVVTNPGIMYLKDRGLGEPCVDVQYMWYKVLIWDNGPEKWLNIYTDLGRYKDPDDFIKVTQNGYIEEDNKYTIPEIPLANPPQLYPMPALAFQWVGAYDGGVKVEQWVEYKSYNCFLPGFDHTYKKKVAEHTAYVYTGRGEINWVGGSDPVEIGKVAKLKYDLGWSNSLKNQGEGGWKIVFTALATGQSWDVELSCNDCTAYIDVEILPSYFKTGVFPNCPDNSIEAKLYNTLVAKDHAWLDVIDIASKAPNLKDVKVNTKGPYKTGESISFTVIGEPNDQSNAKVCEFYMRVDKTGDMEKNTDGNFSYTPGYQGSWTFFFKVQDEFCRPSGEKEIKLQVTDPGKTPPPGDDDELPLLLIILTLIIFAALMVVFNVDPLKSKTPMIARYVVPALITLVAFLVMVQVGLGLPAVGPLFALTRGAII